MKTSTKYKMLADISNTYAPTIYLLWVAGVFKDGLFQTSTGLKSTAMIAFVFLTVKTIMEFHKRANDKDNINYKEVAISKALFRLIPWMLVVAIAFSIYQGIANIYIHIVFVASAQALGSVFIGFYEYYRLIERDAFSKERR